MNIERAKIIVRGAVQGVGFRPFVYRLATELGLNGSVLNSNQGVVIEVEGNRKVIDIFSVRMASEAPTHAVVQGSECRFLQPAGYRGFEILESKAGGTKSALILPDAATCPDCLREIFDPGNRR